MEKRSAEKTLQGILRDGEQVLWSGKTEAFPLLADDAKVQILSKWIGTVAAAVVLLALYIGNAGDGKGLIVGVLVVAVLLVASPFMEQRSVLRQSYWITDQRVILISGDQTVYFMELDGIDGFRTVTGKTEYGSLVLGSCIFEDIRRQLRWRACHPKMDSQSGKTNGAVMGPVLFNLKDCRVAEELLRRYVAGAA